MNKYLFLVLAAGLLWACTDDSAQDSQGTTDSTASSQTEQSTGKVNSPTPAGDSHMEALLMKDYWVFEFYIPKDDSDMEAKLFNRGRWYRFFPDGTYEGGHWQEKKDQGVWKYFVEDGQPKVWMDSANDGKDSEYKIKASGEGDAMSWVGSNRYNQSGIMIKAINLLTMPTKKQFDVEEEAN